MQWTEMGCFRGIDLNDSFVLSWAHGERDLSFVLEASIWPESEYYQTPKAGEYTCYRPAVLRFTNCKRISGLLEMEEARASTDASGEIDYGNIDTLKRTKSGFQLAGDF
jgi:hypothetical protein